ncbi:Repetin [Streptomyces sp. NPDC000594]|uniref:Repetin n=1 Tax=Streptomyces sp. NPDC000594 TaxID=3154261 RepID=UPI003317F88C
MNVSAHRRTLLPALCAVLLAGGGTAFAAQGDGSGGSGSDGKRPAAAAAAPREAAALTGTAKLYRSRGDDITFSFDAHLAAKHRKSPHKATGTFTFRHYLNGKGATARAEVDCLVTGGKVAVVSGVITKTDLPGARGKRVGVTVHDLGGKDRLGYSWATAPITAKGTIPRCVSSAPFEKVLAGSGGFRVLPWQPKL